MSDNQDDEYELELESGHFSDSEQNLDTDTDHGSDVEVVEGESTQFDTNLPSAHKYLGRLNDVGGYTIYDDGEIVSTIAVHTNTLVFPGFTLPLVINNPLEQHLLETFIQQNKTFVLVCANRWNTNMYEYGVTMEIFEMYKKRETLYLKAKGRQRCQILPNRDIRVLTGRIQKLFVKIIAEGAISSPLHNSQLHSLRHYRNLHMQDYEALLKNYKHRRYHLAQYPYSSWIYDRNEITFYVKHVLDRLFQFYIKENLPTDPVQLSYWFIQNFQLTHEERLLLMKLNTALERLKLSLTFLSEKRLICCAICKVDIAKQTDVFAMSKDGVQSNYCNPGGNVYETVTVADAKNFTLHGEPSKEFSWFPGYWWTIMQCRLCKGHIGWKFSSKHLQPAQFYGLAKSRFDIQIVSDRNPSDL